MSEPHMLTSETQSANAAEDRDYWLSRVSDMSELGMIVFCEEAGLEFHNSLATKHLEISKNVFSEGTPYENILLHMANRGDFGLGEAQTFVDNVTQILNTQRTTGDGKASELKLTMPSGRRVLVTQKYDTNGKLLLVSKDISAEEHKSQVLDTALSSVGAGYWYYNCETNVISLHGDYLDKHLSTRQMEWARKEGVFAILHPDDLEGAKSIWEEGLRTGKDWQHTCRIVTRSGASMWLRWTAKPQLSDKGKVISFTSFFEDITHQLETNDALRQAKEAAEKSLKIQNDFLARLSHEIRTPMNGVIGIADALIHHHADEAINPKLEIIQSSAEKILRIVDETLNHTKMHAEKLTLELKPASPAKSVENVVRLWEPKALKNNIKLSYNIDDTVPDILTFDHFRYEQCVNNLLSNAIKFTPNGNINVILTTVRKEGHPPRLVLAVKDDGIGMTPEQQKQIFEAYTQADKSIARRFGGTGLGMTITKEIIEFMGGSITLRSENGKGTIFALTLPMDVESAERKQQNSGALVNKILEDAKPESTNYSELSVLVVDDNATNHMVITSLLESLVGTLHTANNGKEAIEVLKTTDIDIVLMDIHMPVMDGIEATLAIRSSNENWSNVLIIALTADPQYQQIRLCKNIGMDDALSKPVKLVELLKGFDNVLSVRTKSQEFLKSA
ncbi:ATP-binding protein [Hellea sp.]|nr:ATP-binding protein [Hellea sp.]